MVMYLGTHSQNIQVYDITTLEHVNTLSGHIGRVTILCVVESGDYMFSGSSDASVTVSGWGAGRGHLTGL